MIKYKTIPNKNTVPVNQIALSKNSFLAYDIFHNLFNDFAGVQKFICHLAKYFRHWNVITLVSTIVYQILDGSSKCATYSKEGSLEKVINHEYQYFFFSILCTVFISLIVTFWFAGVINIRIPILLKWARLGICHLSFFLLLRLPSRVCQRWWIGQHTSGDHFAKNIQVKLKQICR